MKIWSDWRYWLIPVIALICAWLASGCSTTPMKEASIEYRKMLPGTRMIELPGQEVKEYVGLHVDLAPVKFVSWENTVHMLSTTSKVAWVGWQFALMACADRFKAGFYHHSQHCLDCTHPLFWPNENGIVVIGRIYP